MNDKHGMNDRYVHFDLKLSLYDLRFLWACLASKKELEPGGKRVIRVDDPYLTRKRLFRKVDALVEAEQEVADRQGREQPTAKNQGNGLWRDSDGSITTISNN